jgi:hypothetical protein
MKKKLCYYILTLFCSLFFYSLASYAITEKDEAKNLSLLFYVGQTSQQQFGQLLQFKFNSAGETIYTTELAYILNRNNIIRRVFHPIFDVMQIAANAGLRVDTWHHDNVEEGDLYLIGRRTEWPWNHYLNTSLAIGDGISYVSHVPYVDKLTADTDAHFQRLLNYLMIETTFALPSKPEWQLALRLHHRCTMYGVYGHGNAGSTSVGAGIRYYF